MIMSALELLLVEDNPEEVLLFREALRALPTVVHVTIAYDGERALELLGGPAFHPDLIVVDLNLPRINGHTVLEFLKSRPGPPVVVFSVSANPRDRKRALDLGARDYVVKPRTRDELFATVRKMVELRFEGRESAANGTA